MKRIGLGTVGRGIAGDDIYRLVIPDEGEPFVQFVRDYNQPYKTDDVSIISPENYEGYTVNGVSLKDLVENKLKELKP